MSDRIDPFKGLDVFSKSKRKRCFVWDDDGLPPGCRFKLYRTNTVMMGYIYNRATGEAMKLTPDFIEYTGFTESADPKFRSQRSDWHWIIGTTSLIYFTGKILSVGGDTSLVAFAGLYMTACALLHNMREETGAQFLIGGIRVVNGVLAGSMGGEVDMRMLANVKMDKMTVRYEKDLFSGLVLTPKGGGGTITVFESGKFILAGASTNERVKAAMTRLHAIVTGVPGLLEPSDENNVRVNTRNTGRRNVKRGGGAGNRRARRAHGRYKARKVAAEREIVDDRLWDLV